MKESDVRPGMFISDVAKTISDPILVYVVSDDLDEEAFKIVDLHRDTLSFLHYYAINDDYEEFDGDLDKARYEVMRVVLKSNTEGA